MIDLKPIVSKTDYIVRIVSILTSICVVAAIIVDYGFVLDAHEMSFILSVYNAGWWVYFISFAFHPRTGFLQMPLPFVQP